MTIRDEKSELLQIINSIPAKNYKNFGYGVPVVEVCNAFNGSKGEAESWLLQLEQEGKVEIYRQSDLPDMLLVVRTI